MLRFPEWSIAPARRLVALLVIPGFLTCVLEAAETVSFSCAGRLDQAFAPPGSIRVPLFVNSRVHLEVAADDRIVVGGDLSGQPGVVRLQADGKYDESFGSFTIPFELGEFPRINSMALQPDGKVLVAGWITHMDRPLIRLKANGGIDGEFSPAFEMRPEGSVDIQSMALDSSGGIYVSGNFTHVNGVFRRGLARLTSTGALDETFAPNFLPNGPVLVSMPLIVPYTNGSVLVVVTNTVLKLEATGAVSQNFTPFESPVISAIAVDAEKRILVGRFDEDVYPQLTRLLPNGEIDETFSTEDFSFQSIGSHAIDVIRVQPDGKILVGGGFTDEENRTPSIARFFPDGRLDESFRPFIEQNGWADDVESVTSIGFQASGRIIIGGDFAMVDGTERRGVARLYREAGDCEGVLQFATNEMTVEESGGIARVKLKRSGDLQTAASVMIDFRPSENEIPARPGEDYLIGETRVMFAAGEATKVFELPVVNDGRVETSEVVHAKMREVQGGLVLHYPNDLRIVIKDDDSQGLPGMPQEINYGSNITVMAVEIDGISRAVVGGSFTNLAGQSRTNLARLNADGTVDGSFFGRGVPFIVYVVHIINGYGPILVGGDGAFVKLHPDGTPDESFNVTLGGISPRVTEILRQPDGKIIIAGKFTTVNGVNRQGLARLHENGALDSSFDPPGGITNITEWHIEPTGLAIQSDGKLIVAGDFLTVGGFQNYGLVRLDTNGVPDQTYAPGIDGPIGAILLQDDGKLVIGGDFSAVNQQFRRGLARLSSTGALDESFLGDAQIDNRKYNVTELHQGWDRRLSVAGNFNYIGSRGLGDSIFRRGVARMDTNGVIDRLFYTGLGADGRVHDVVFGLDGSLLVGGEFRHFNGESHEGLVRLHGDSLVATGRVSFAATDFAGTEEESVVRVRFVRQWGTNGTVSASYRTHGGNATAGIDYESSGGVVTFLPGEMEKEVLITIHDDSEVELWDGFQLSLRDGPLGLIPDASVFIQDDEKGFVFEREVFDVQEGANVTIRLLHIGPLEDSVLLNIEAVAGTATVPADFPFFHSSFVATPDNLPITLTIPTVADGVDEPIEQFTVQIGETSRPIAKGPPARVLIRGWDDGLTFSSAEYADGEFSVTVSAEAGVTYNVYVSTDLQNWSFLDRAYSFGNVLRITDRAPTEVNARFYLIEEDPPF